MGDSLRVEFQITQGAFGIDLQETQGIDLVLVRLRATGSRSKGLEVSLGEKLGKQDS